MELRRALDRQGSDADAVPTEHDHRPAIQILGGLRQVRGQQGSLLARREVVTRPQQDDGRAGLSAASEQGAEVGVARHQDTIVCSGAIKDVLIGRTHHVEVGYMQCVVTRLPQSSRDHWRQTGIDQQPHTGSTTGSSRSCIAAAKPSAWYTSCSSRHG